MGRTTKDYAMLLTDTLVSDGGHLRPDDGDKFYDQLISGDNVLSKVQKIQMTRSEQRIPRAGFINTVSVPGNFDPTYDTAPWNGRELAYAGQSEPDISSVTLTSKSLRAVVPLANEVLEDNIEREDFADKVLGWLGNAVKRDVSYIAFQGDTASSSYPTFDVRKTKNVADGWLKKVPAGGANNIVLANATVTPFNAERITDLDLALGDEYKMERDKVAILISPKQEALYRNALINLGTDGVQLMTLLGGTKMLPATGFELIVTPFMPEDQALITPINNLLFGVHRDVKVRVADQPEKDQVLLVVTARIAFNMLDPGGTVLMSGLSTTRA